MTAAPQSQPMTATARPVCCYCDADLSCGSCGREQPYDDISALKARIQELIAAGDFYQMRLNTAWCGKGITSLTIANGQQERNKLGIGGLGPNGISKTLLRETANDPIPRTTFQPRRRFPMGMGRAGE